MEEKLQLAIKTIFDALTTVWDDNGNVMADAVRDSVITNLCQLTGMSFDEIVTKVDQMVDNAQ